MNLLRRLQSTVTTASGILLLVGLVAFGGYAYFCWRNTWTMPGGADSSGYFNLARCLERGEIHAPARPIEGLPPTTLPSFAYVPLGFQPNPVRGTMTPTYPIGVPAAFLAGAKCFGWFYGPDLVLWLHTLAGVWFTYALARQAGASIGGALIGATALAVSPLYLNFGLQAMSDVPALTWSVAALWFAGRRTRTSATMAGLAFGFAVLVRPSNALLMPALVVALGWNWRRLLAFGLGGLPMAVAFLGFNRAAYGSPLVTGYGDIGSLMRWAHVPITSAHYGRWFPVLLSPLVVLVLAWPWLMRSHRRPAIVHALVAAPVLVFYAFYYHTHETWWYLRFVLPVFPSLIVLATLGGEMLVAKIPSSATRGVWAAVGLTIVVVNGVAWSTHFGVRSAGRNERIYPAAVRLAQNLPANAVLVAMQTSGALFYGTEHIVVRWDTLEGNWPRIRDAARAAGRPIYAVFFEFEVKEAFVDEKTPGDWEKIIGQQDLSIWRLRTEPTPAR